MVSLLNLEAFSRLGATWVLPVPFKNQQMELKLVCRELGYESMLIRVFKSRISCRNRGMGTMDCVLALHVPWNFSLGVVVLPRFIAVTA